MDTNNKVTTDANTSRRVWKFGDNTILDRLFGEQVAGAIKLVVFIAVMFALSMVPG